MAIDFSRLFEPQTVAIVGASAVKVPGRYDYIDWLGSSEFSGSLYPVNPKYQEIKGHKCYPALKDIPGTVDIAVIMIPAEKAVELLRETPSGKVKFVIMITSGFSEIGETELERELVDVATSRGMRVIGPNCMGVFSRRGKMPQCSAQPFGADSGEIAILAQSGGNSANLVRATVNSGLIPNCSVSYGNQCDLCMEDFLEYYDTNDDIKLIMGYVEDFKHGKKFAKLASEISTRKPIILWKGGTTPQGSQAAMSHTGAVAIPGAIWEGVIRQAGIIPADNVLDTINFSRALLWETLPQGPGVCVMFPGGGGSVTMTDCAIHAGLDVPPFSQSIRKELSKSIAKVNTSTNNPIDFGAASYVPQTIKDTIATIAKDDNIHSFIFNHFIYPFKGFGAREIANDRLTALSEVRRTIDKPIYVALYRSYYNIPEVDEANREAFEYMNELKIPYTIDTESCVKTVRRMWDYSRYLQSRKKY